MRGGGVETKDAVGIMKFTIKNIGFDRTYATVNIEHDNMHYDIGMLYRDERIELAAELILAAEELLEIEDNELSKKLSSIRELIPVTK